MKGAAQLRLDAALLKIGTDLEAALADLARAQRNADVLERTLAPQSEAAYRSALASYQQGRGDLMPVLDTVRQRLQIGIDRLKARAEARGISLTWSRPTRYVDGRQLKDLAAFVVFRREVSSGCPDCPAPYRERTTLNVEDQEKFIKKKQLGFVDEELEPQTIYRYRVFSQLRDGSLGNPSNEVEVTWKP